LTDPPSVEGTCGPQLAPEEAVPAAVPADGPDAELVVFAFCVDVLDASPDNCAGISGSIDALPFIVPAAPPLEALPCNDGKADVGTLSGSDAVPPPLLPVVWACAIEKPRRTTARAKVEVHRIVLS
jgi:hypothetical protein